MSIPFWTTVAAAAAYAPLTIVILLHYLRDRSIRRLHLLAAFVFFSLGLLASGTEEVMLVTGGPSAAATFIFRFFDIFSMVGVFWFFVFMSDFVDSQKRFVGFSAAWLLLVVVAILVSPVKMVRVDAAWSEVRGVWSSAAVALYWLANFGAVSYQYFKHARLITERGPRRRIMLMGGGALAAIAPFILVTVIKLALPSMLVWSEVAASAFAVVSGALFYLGAETPSVLKPIIEGTQ